MAVTDLFSKRRKRGDNQTPSTYCYDELSTQLRQQIWYIVQDTFVESLGEMCVVVNDILCREYGQSSLLSTVGTYRYSNTIQSFILYYYNVDEVLDAIELLFNDHIFNTIEGYEKDAQNLKKAIEELNYRFKEHNVGYQFQANQIIRVDSMYMQLEVVEPVLKLINNLLFSGACDEYLKAHKHYKAGNNKECLNECLKAFESTMKIICKEKGWNYDQEKDTASKLIAICFGNGLFPEYMTQQFTSLRSMLESGIPPIRNRNGGHGQGDIIKTVSDSLARYTINLTGCTIIFLIEQSGL